MASAKTKLYVRQVSDSTLELGSWCTTKQRVVWITPITKEHFGEIFDSSGRLIDIVEHGRTACIEVDGTMAVEHDDARYRYEQRAMVAA